MRNRGKSALAGGRAAIFLWLLILLPLICSAEDATGSDSKSYVVGLSVLADAGLPASARPFLVSFPRLLALAATPLPPRLAEEAYRSELADKSFAATAFKLGSDLASKLDAMAAADLDPSLVGPKRKESLSTARAAVTKATEALDAGLIKKEETTGEEQPREASFWTSTDSSSALLEPGKQEPLAFAKSNKVDLLLVGRAEPLGPYISVTISGYEVNLGREVFSWTGQADPADPSPLATRFAGLLLDWVAGGPYGRLDIGIDPSSALVIVNGKPLDESERSLFFFFPTRLELRAWAPGFSGQEERIDMEPGDRKRIDLTLPPAAFGAASITSEPEGASVYLGERRLGETPLETELSGARTVAIAEMPGYETARQVLPAEGRADITLTLRPEDGLGPGGRVLEARDRFYRSLGWFVLSLPAASLSLGSFSIYNEAYLRSGEAGLYASRSAAGVVFGASAAAGVGLAINAIIDLVAYVRATR